ncbi:MAG: TetR/AcrR family transcriptional regulator [Acidobacteria bacterium]|nr:TetR/AcrR family transcriptional regulator [Acidobacteriota bacterium]MBV9477985.1 TetR/AcrR family transcriptional regulator [Acidobacteriota bacterium]
MRNTSERILDIAEEIYRAEGAETLSMRGVADQLGLSATALYRHYDSKEALLDAVAERGFLELAGAFQRSSSREPRERLRAIFDAFRNFAVKKPALFDLMFFSRRSGARLFPSALRAGASPSGSVLTDVLTEMGVDDPVEIGLLFWSTAQGLISLYRAGRFESERAFRRSWDGCFQRLLATV